MTTYGSHFSNLRLKRLELVGFKSFVEPTVIDFDAPIIGIVGPNGCGKSNVVDALRWVMGEMSAKSLRGRSMEDVIFNGSEKRPPLGMAEVSLTFSTEDGIAPADYAGFSEITVARRLYRSGDSEYLINKVPGRLRDIIDLFLGTGVGHKAYSVIEQGKIDFAINAKPEDRRLLIEEAAGVSKFKARKESALRKMEGTEQNLARLKDILNEVSRQINSLDRQVKKAERYKILKNELRELDLKLSSLAYLDQSQELVELKALLEDWNTKEATSGAQLATIENELERGRLELVEKDREYNTLQERYFEVSSRLKLLEAQEGFQKKELVGLEELKQQAMGRISEMKERRERLKNEKEEEEKKRLGLESDSDDSLLLLEASEQEWKEIEGTRDQISRRIEVYKEERHQIDSQIGRLEGEKRLHSDRKATLKGQIARKDVGRDETRQRFEGISTQLQTKKEHLQEITRECQSFHEERDQIKSDLARHQERKEILSQELSLRREEFVLKRSRLKSLLDLEKNFEGYEEGVRAVLKAKKERGVESGIFGVVADFIEMSPQYEMAVSAALGEKLQYVIVKSHEEGVEAINCLKAESSGRSTFIPMEVRETSPNEFPYQHEGVVGPLLNRVRLKEGYQRIGQYLLGDVILVQTLSDALSLWRSNGHKKTLVTLEGEVVDPSGVVSGGITGIHGKIFLEKKREIKELRGLTAELEEEIGLKEDTLSQLEGNLSELSLNLEQISRRLHDEEMKRMTSATAVQHLEEDHQRIEGELIKIDVELAELMEEGAHADHFMSECESKRTSLLKAIFEKEQETEALEKEHNEILLRVRQAQEKLTGLRIQTAATSERKTMVTREAERLTATEEELRGRIDQEMASITEGHQKMNLIHKALEQASLEMTTLKKIAEEMAVSLEMTRRNYESLASSLQEKGTLVRDRRKQNDLAKSHTGDIRVTLSRLETELSHLEQQILEKYSVNLAEIAPTYAGRHSMGVIRGREDSPPDSSETSSSRGGSASGGGFASVERIDRAAEEARSAELKEKLEKLGDVNLGAIPEYEELKGRQEFLGKQITDLEESLNALRKAIQRINQTTRKRFEETFALVNERFSTLFPRIFQGGRAELRLSQGEDLLNAGVEILVQPPGKKLSHVGLLSGGEKAMAAIAFVFSIFLVKPSPFCILDEVDAPLDDVNCQQFHNLLSEMVSRTQFVLITHNRRTMEKADLLYGVTMQEPGISQVVSVRISEGLKLAS